MNNCPVCLRRALLEQAGITGDAELHVEGERPIIFSARQPRQGWEAQFSAMSRFEDDRLEDELLPTRWEQEQWEW